MIDHLSLCQVKQKCKVSLRTELHKEIKDKVEVLCGAGRGKKVKAVMSGGEMAKKQVQSHALVVNTYVGLSHSLTDSHRQTFFPRNTARLVQA